MPGDEFEIVDGVVYANGEKIEWPEYAQMEFLVKTNGQLNPKLLKEQYDINPNDISFDAEEQAYLISMPEETVDDIRSLGVVTDISLKLKDKGAYEGTSMPIFPNDPAYDWTEDNFGPLYIPKKGDKIELTLTNLPLYQRVIEVYEHNDLELKGNAIYINGEPASDYTFKQNYYMLMGDNRHHSADSRFWGFVPEDHVVGEAEFIWFSKDPYTGIRWDRVFSLVN
jgi:signal peptidase I